MELGHPNPRSRKCLRTSPIIVGTAKDRKSLPFARSEAIDCIDQTQTGDLDEILV